MGQTRLGGSFVIRVLQLILQWIELPLGGQRRGLSLSSLVSSSITHQHVILCLHSSSLLFQLSFYCCDLMNMAQSSYIVYLLAFTLFHTQFKSKINRAIILIWESKQLLCFNTFELLETKDQPLSTTIKKKKIPTMLKHIRIVNSLLPCSNNAVK